MMTTNTKTTTTTQTDGLQLEYVALEDLQEWPSNPKSHDIGLISQAVGRWGFLNPVLVDERTGLLNAGHGRLKTLTAMRDDGQSPPRYVRVDDEGRWHLPVLRGWSSASDADAAARAVSDNRTQERGQWDDTMLAEVMSELAQQGESMLEGVGFDLEDVDDLLARVSGPPNLDDLEDQHGDPEESALWPTIRLRVPQDTYERWQSLMREAPGATEHQKVAALLAAVDAAALGGPLGVDDLDDDGHDEADA